MKYIRSWKYSISHKVNKYSCRLLWNLKVYCCAQNSPQIQLYKQPTRCNSNIVLVTSISSTCFWR